MENTFKTLDTSVSGEPTGTSKTPEFKPAESVVVPATATPKTTNIPLDKWTQDNNVPYSSKFFETDTPFDFLPAEVQSKMQDIDKFVDLELADRGLKHDTFSYEQVLNDLMLELGALDGDLMDRVDRLHGYASNILKLDGLDDIRAQIKAKLRRLQTKKDMDDLILREIGKKII